MTQRNVSYAILAISVPSLLLALSGCAMKSPSETRADAEPGTVATTDATTVGAGSTAATAGDPLALESARPDEPVRQNEVVSLAAALTDETAPERADDLEVQAEVVSARPIPAPSLAEDAGGAMASPVLPSGGTLSAKSSSDAPSRRTVAPRESAGAAAATRSGGSAPVAKADAKKERPQREERASAPPPALQQAPVAAVGGATVATGATGQGRVAPPPPPVEPVVVQDRVGSSEEYTDHGVNPYTLATNDRHSTFSIDVDTAAYTVARRKLQEGSLPPEAAVRVEEFVNYFNYDSYAQPTDGPFSVNMEAMPDPFRPGHHTLRVGVQGKELSRGERPDLHITFLVDVSGSMQSADKLPLAKKSMHMMVDGLNEGDTVALATYAGQVARILAPTKAMHKRQIHDAIDRLGAGGSTAMSAGIDLAYGMAMETFEKGAENRVVVLSDGDANVGNSSFDTLLSQIKGYADRGVTLSTIGLGMGNYRDTLMEQLANKGDGNNFYIDSQAQAQRVFVEELGGSMITIARDVKIQVEFNPEAVSAYRLVGYENRDIADKDFRNDRVDAGEVGSGHDVTAIYDVILKDGYAAELATVRMRYEAPGADKAAQEKAWRFHASALKKADSQAHKDTRIAYAAATFAEVLRGSPTASEINMDALIRYAQAAARPGEKDDQELVALMKRARDLGAGERGQALSLR